MWYNSFKILEKGRINSEYASFILLYLFHIYKMLGKVWLEIMINGNTLMVWVETVGFGFGGK
jgi:hypothetical protein